MIRLHILYIQANCLTISQELLHRYIILYIDLYIYVSNETQFPQFLLIKLNSHHFLIKGSYMYFQNAITVLIRHGNGQMISCYQQLFL